MYTVLTTPRQGIGTEDKFSIDTSSYQNSYVDEFLGSDFPLIHATLFSIWPLLNFFLPEYDVLSSVTIDSGIDRMLTITISATGIFLYKSGVHGICYVLWGKDVTCWDFGILTGTEISWTGVNTTLYKWMIYENASYAS